MRARDVNWSAEVTSFVELCDVRSRAEAVVFVGRSRPKGNVHKRDRTSGFSTLACRRLRRIVLAAHGVYKLLEISIELTTRHIVRETKFFKIVII
ncbi:hypothetical protein EVAR_59189_1 [Eumeta japonica]|uniref:Uncharacterized protein n=1 Tax=Eumeta variegata TaxID=151549 RepID=A0A4C1ZDB9_EUMVA|nr:hypothetical protein EVAR_59189_1 [Eumeta japonica]